MDINNSPNETRSIGPNIDNAYFTDKADYDILIERENALAKNNVDTNYVYNNDLIYGTTLNNLLEAESPDSKVY